ncbi:glycosyltransferase family 2 protein [Streptococcus mitis]|uniref:glycosyltransferase family 2 protein n=1 Tax=Streptococcus mitis TaxID=28037 RepID=UPI0021B72FA0|nr:glycosyltransferase family 2 protein [Streptococcus mitis]
MISVIVPVYNVEEYLEECLESIRKQSYQDIEVILVNDGSTDGSQAICEHFCQTDNRFRLINQKNQGLSVARNRGVKDSLGEYIMFVDSDDVVKENIIEVLLSYMKPDVDLVECNLTQNKEELQKNKPIQVVFEGNSPESIIKCIAFKEVKFCAFTKLYRREIVEKVPFLEGIIYEDVYTGMNYLKYIRKMVAVDLKGYYYRVRPNSIMTTSFSEKNLDIITVGNKLIESFQDDGYLLPYIGYFMFYLGLSHYQRDGITRKSPYVDVYENFIRECAFIAKQSQEVVGKYRLLRLYLMAPKYFTIITHPVYQFIDKIWNNFKMLIHKL